jgi:pyridoxal biosynthesis lyase PdxS
MRAHVLTGLALVAVGCASHPAPTQQVASSVAAVRSADEAGAREIAESAVHVKLAEDQIAQAKQLMEDEDDNLRAEDLALRAYQDAELALAIAREQTAQRKINQFTASTGSAGGEQVPAPMGQQPPSSPTSQPSTP